MPRKLNKARLVVAVLKESKGAIVAILAWALGAWASGAWADDSWVGMQGGGGFLGGFNISTPERTEEPRPRFRWGIVWLVIFALLLLSALVWIAIQKGWI